MTNTNFLPDGYETLRSEKKYINLGKLPEGEIRLRIVQKPIAGWIDWKDQKPHRYKPNQQPKNSFDPEKPMRAFWAVYVWDYAREDLFVMEITQNTIKKSLEEYALNEDWGDLTQYDIKIKKEGTGKETKYTVIPIPPKPMAQEILMALEFTPVRLEALYEGKDPWKDLTPSYDDMNAEIDMMHGLSDKECAQIDMLFNSIPVDARKKHESAIKNHLKINDLYEADSRDFDKMIRYLEKVIVVQNKEVVNG